MGGGGRDPLTVIICDVNSCSWGKDFQITYTSTSNDLSQESLCSLHQLIISDRHFNHCFSASRRKRDRYSISSSNSSVVSCSKVS